MIGRIRLKFVWYRPIDPSQEQYTPEKTEDNHHIAMSVSPISSPATPSPATVRSTSKEISPNLAALQNALKSGDVSSAQQALATLKTDMQNFGPAGGDRSNPANKDYLALQSALQSGNLSDAQAAFARLKRDVQASHHARGNENFTSATSNTSGTSSTPHVSSSGSGLKRGIDLLV